MANSSNRRKKALMVLGLLAWLLLLGFISYRLCLPDLEEVSQQLRAIREDPNLTPEEKFEKTREVLSKVTRDQGRQAVQNDFKKFAYERNAEMQRFLKMSPEEQVAYLKQKAEERKKLGPKDGLNVFKPGGGVFKSGGGGAGAGASMPGGVQVRSVSGGPGGGGYMFMGPAGGGPGKPEQVQKTMLDNFSPETRAGQFYQKGLLSK